MVGGRAKERALRCGLPSHCPRIRAFSREAARGVARLAQALYNCRAGTSVPGACPASRTTIVTNAPPRPRQGEWPVALRKKVGAVMVVGAGIGGMRAAADLAESGMRVYLVEARPAIGGIVSQLGFMFPTHDCVLCRGTGEHGYGCTRPSITPKLLDYDLHPNIQLMTTTQVVAVSGEPGSFHVRVRHEPRYVDVRRCINCDACAQVCPVERPSVYQAGLVTRKAAYKVAPRSVPDAYVIDRGDYCNPCLKCQEVCPTHAIDL
ncbi:MAG: FAD-dependent oxidoreductase, partial [Anaerolineae bacterium]|nr:FAD-dependent oxidoreductase [Anaerolineae bacterium]